MFNPQRYADKCLICAPFAFHMGLAMPEEYRVRLDAVELPNDTKEIRHKILAKEIKKLTNKLKFSVRKEYEHDEKTIKNVTDTYETLVKLTGAPSVYQSKVEYSKDCGRLIVYLGAYYNEAYFAIGLSILDQLIYA